MGSGTKSLRLLHKSTRFELMMKGVQKNILVFQSLSSIFKMFYENVSDMAEFFKLLSLCFTFYILIIYLDSSHFRAIYYAFNCKSDLLWNWPTYSIFCPIIFRLYLSSFLTLTLYPISLMCVWVCTIREQNQRHGTTLFVAVFNKNLFCKVWNVSECSALHLHCLFRVYSK